MGKQKGQTHDYRVEYVQDHQPPGDKPQRRVRGDWADALLLARMLARRDDTLYAKLIHVHPVSKREKVLAHYTHDNAPPDNDEDIRGLKGQVTTS